jgi:phenylalanyl-tRNA synthetase beta chain
VGARLYEVMSYSFVSPRDFDRIKIPADSPLRKVITILNPLGEEMSIMRTTLIPNMMEVIARNNNKKTESGQFFEMGRVYRPVDEPGRKLPDEKLKLCIGMYGGFDFLDIKGTIELLLKNLGIRKYEFIRDSENPSFHPGKTARLILRKKSIGTFGEIHPDVLENYGLPMDVYMCELDLDEIIKCCEQERKFKQLPRYPAVERDMALLVSEDIMVSQIESIIRHKGGNLVEEIRLFDVYKGKQIPEGKKSIAYSIIYRSEDRTLKDEEINRVHESIIKALESELDAQLRL